MPKKRTHEEFITMLHDINPDVEALGLYQGAMETMSFRCRKDGYEWKTTPSSIFSGTKCPRCANKEHYTPESFKQKLFGLNPNIELLTDYTKGHSKVLCRCLLDGHEWECKAYLLLSGRGCPRCAANFTLSNEDFLSEMKKHHPKIRVLSDYNGMGKQIHCKCSIDGYEWDTTPTRLLCKRKQGCPKCSGRLKLTHDEFVSRMSDVCSTIQIIGQYQNYSTKILCRCDKCGTKWEAIPNALLDGHGCPICNTKISKGEQKIISYLDRHHIPYETQYRFEDCRYKNTLPFDFYICSLNTLIEYDGIQHFKPATFGKRLTDNSDAFRELQLRDQIKTEYCASKNIRLIRIPYTDFDNIETILDKQLL